MYLSLLQDSFSGLVAGGRKKPESPLEVTPGGTLTPEQSFEVYRRAYVVRLTEALGETFEAVWRVLGDDEFFRIAEVHISESPSKFYNLSDYGDAFPETLKKYYGEVVPFLFHLARFELVFKNMFHAKQHLGVQPEVLNKLDRSKDLRIEFGSAVALFDAPFAAYELWKRRLDSEIEITSLGLDKPQSILIYKKEEKIFVHILSRAEYDIVKSLMSGTSLHKTLESASGIAEESTVSALFALLYESGSIAEVEYAN